MPARIYQPSRNAMQSGKGKAGRWVLQFDASERRSRDPLMGWTSSNDMMQQVKMRFDSKQDAIDYAERAGLAYTVETHNQPTRRRKAYADNFKFGRHANWTH